MKQILKWGLMMIMLLMTLGTYAQEGDEVSVPLSQPGKKGKLVVSSMMGPVTVIASSRQDVLVKYASKGLLHKNEDDEDEEEDKDAVGMRRISSGGLKFDITERNNEVEVKNTGFFKYAALTIEVPTSFDIKIRTMTDGDIVIQGVRGELDVESLNGDLDISNVSGAVLANAMNGNIKVSMAQVNNDVPMAFTTFNGKIDVAFPAALKANFKLRSMNGEVFTDFDFTPTETKSTSNNRDSEGMYKISVNKWMSGAVNGGGPEMKMETYNGNIYIRKKG